MNSAERNSHQTLKGRQLDCMLLVKEGLTSKQVARTLGISPRTVDQHVAAAIEKLGAPNRTAAISRLHELDINKKPPTPASLFMLTDAPEVDLSHLIECDEPPKIDAILPPIGGTRNRASPKQKFVWVVRITIMCLMITSLSILTLLGIIEMVRSIDQ